MQKNTFISIIAYSIFVLILHFLSIKYCHLSNDTLMLFRFLGIAGLFFIGIKKQKLPIWIIIALVTGIEIGYDFPAIGKELDVLSKLFLRLIKTIIAPLIFATLVFGIAGHSNMKQVGRMAWKSLTYFYIATTCALFIGLAAINLFPVGKGITLPQNMEQKMPDVVHKTWKDHILDIVPENITKSISEGQVLQVVIFSILFGIALAFLDDRLKKPMLDFSESLAEVMFKFTHFIMYLAPFGVGGAIAYTVAKLGLQPLLHGLYLILLLYGTLIAFIVLVLLPVCIIFKLNIKQLFKAVSEPVGLAFATASSESALPKAMKHMELFGVPRKVVSFVMPLGYSFNLDGTTLYLSLASIFVAQACGMNLPFSQQLLIVFTLMITSKGVAGVPRASFVILLGTIASFGMKEWPLYLILGIDAFMDMGRTSVNVLGNCVASAAVARWENELDDNKMNTMVLDKSV
jgi:proton glutamate symport protein